MDKRGWDEVDFIVVSGDAYVDHPSFAAAILSRLLENIGFRVGIIAQPRWNNLDDIMKLGRPKYGFLVSAGNIDTMVAHYSVNKNRRRKDSYSPGGEIGHRPDRATIVYCNLIRRAYKHVPIIIGGIEASLRRFAHYDYWEDKVRRSILIDSSADLLVYGMGENQLIDIAMSLRDGLEVKYIRHIPGTAYVIDDKDEAYDYIEVPSFEDVNTSKELFAKAFNEEYKEQNPHKGKTIIQKHRDKYIVQNSPCPPLSTEELDRVYDLRYMRESHPVYNKQGGIPALNEVKFSIISERGCFGSCSFCSLTFHQGKIVKSRSHESILDEAQQIIEDKDFKGYIHDVGGPTANFRKPSCSKQDKHGTCQHKECLFPNPCSNLEVDHSDYLSLLKKLRDLEGVKKVFVRSGLRYDYIMADSEDRFLRELCEHHVSGQLKVAPEHISDKVLRLMGKPSRRVYDGFVHKFNKINDKMGKKQFIVPYLMSSHPGSTMEVAIELAEYIRDMGHYPEQVQDFYPTPGTLSTCMYYTGFDPRTMEKVYVPKSKMEKAMQRALLQYKNPKNYDLVHKALIVGNREDLIGFDQNALIRPKNSDGGKNTKHRNNKSKKKHKKKNKR